MSKWIRVSTMLGSDSCSSHVHYIVSRLATTVCTLDYVHLFEGKNCQTYEWTNDRTAFDGIKSSLRNKKDSSKKMHQRNVYGKLFLQYFTTCFFFARSFSTMTKKGELIKFKWGTRPSCWEARLNTWRLKPYIKRGNCSPVRWRHKWDFFPTW